MSEKFFLHRIQKESGAFTKGIEAHDNLDDAIRSFWGRVKTGYNNPDNPGMTFVSCKITDNNGGAYPAYNKTWIKAEEESANVFFLHSIRVEGNTVTKAIDAYDTIDAAMVAYASAMEYGYNNPRFPDVTFVSCEITDILSGGLVLSSDWWTKPEPEPETNNQA